MLRHKTVALGLGVVVVFVSGVDMCAYLQFLVVTPAHKTPSKPGKRPVSAGTTISPSLHKISGHAVGAHAGGGAPPSRALHVGQGPDPLWEWISGGTPR